MKGVKSERISLGDGWDFIKVENLEKLNEFCYFCDFNEVTPHKHHIIRKSDGGKDKSNNIIPLCANHHELVHRRIYVLAFNPKSGLYFLVNRKTRKVISPTERQRHYKRELPLSSINNSNNLTITGDLMSKGVISVNDFVKTQSKIQKKRIRNGSGKR